MRLWELLCLIGAIQMDVFIHNSFIHGFHEVILGWLKMMDIKMTDHQNCRAWNCRTWNWRTWNCEIAGRENDGPISRTWNCRIWNCTTWKCRTWKCRTWKWRNQKWRHGTKLQENKIWVLTEITITLQYNEMCKCFNPKHRNTLRIPYGLIPACAQVGKLSPLYFNLRHFSNGSSNWLLRSNAKSTQYIQPQTFAASESVSYPALLCPAI